MEQYEKNRKKGYGAEASGIGTANYGEVNKSYDEEKFHASQGHGFAAERANNMVDMLHGKDARIVGDDNSKNGADRIVDGVEIQSKYCQTGKSCIDACFDEKGQFRYFSKNGKPMQIEVPSDKYDVAVQAMEEKIRNGQVKGVTDPSEAKNIVRKGYFTYDQACNIAKAGTVESLIYDAANGAVIATSAFGVTALISFAASMWGGKDFDESLKIAAAQGIKVGGTAFATTIIAGQLSKAGLNSALVKSSEAIVNLMGPKASAVLINAFRSGSNFYGAAAMKSAAKLLRGNAITSGVTIVVLSAFDIADIFRGRISGEQLFKNVTNTVSSVAGSTGGWIGGAAIGSAIFPGVGSVIGGIIGSFVCGAAAGGASNAILDNFIEDDAETMVRIIQDVFTQMCGEYLLTKSEAEHVVDRLGRILDAGTLKDMYASCNWRNFARRLLEPLIKDEIGKRCHIRALTDAEMVKGLKSLLEETADAATA